MEPVQPEIVSDLPQVGGMTFAELLAANDSALANALRRIEGEADQDEDLARFGSFT